MGQRNLLVAQSGGATAVINASLVGVVEAARSTGRFDAVLGARRGITGILERAFIDLGNQPEATLRAVMRTPSAALGTTRHRLSDDEAHQAITVLAELGIRAVAYIGGNDSADTALRLTAAADAAGYELAVISVPKTIDNDLPATDHAPGYGSIARFLAQATRDAARDTEATANLYPVKLIEVMGRNAGWVAAATALGQEKVGDAPHLIFFPERPPRDLDAFLDDIQAAYRRWGFVIAVIPETLKDGSGRALGGADVSWVDSFGHRYYPGPSPLLTRAVEEQLGLRTRYDKPGTIARMFTTCISEVDLTEAYEAGAHAARLLAEQVSGVMVTFERVSTAPYAIRIGTVPLDAVANHERHLPDTFIGGDGRSVTDAFRAYALPLIGGPLPAHGRLIDLPYPPNGNEAPSSTPR